MADTPQGLSRTAAHACVWVLEQLDQRPNTARIPDHAQYSSRVAAKPRVVLVKGSEQRGNGSSADALED